MGSTKKRKLRAVAPAEPVPDRQHKLAAQSHTDIYLPAILLFLATALLYNPSLNNLLILDDLPFFVESRLDKLGSSFFHLELRWVSYVTFGWTYKLFGFDWLWYRLGNLMLHALTGFMLFLFFSRLLQLTTPVRDGYW